MTKTIKVAVLPGKVTEVAVDDNATFAQAIEVAEVSAAGYEVKADGRTITNLDENVGSTSMILLAKQVKGNAPTTLKVAMLPGKVVEIALDDSATFADAIEQAEFDTAGYEVKADGRTLTNLNESIGSTSMVLLAKQVKGNTSAR